MQKLIETLFQSTSSSRSQTYMDNKQSYRSGFQSTSSSRSQTPSDERAATKVQFQSTSSSRSQTKLPDGMTRTIQNFNPLAPRGARREMDLSGTCDHRDFNPLAPRGARQSMTVDPLNVSGISIH